MDEIWAGLHRLHNEVRRSRDWEGWTRFFLEGVAEIAEESATTAATSIVSLRGTATGG